MVTISTPTSLEMTIVAEASSEPVLTLTQGTFLGTWSTLANGVLQFSDRSAYTMSGIPEEFLGQWYFKGPCDSGVVGMTVSGATKVSTFASFGNSAIKRNGITMSSSAANQNFPSMTTTSFSSSGFQVLFVVSLNWEKLDGQRQNLVPEGCFMDKSKATNVLHVTDETDDYKGACSNIFPCICSFGPAMACNYGGTFSCSHDSFVYDICTIKISHMCVIMRFFLFPLFYYTAGIYENAPKPNPQPPNEIFDKCFCGSSGTTCNAETGRFCFAPLSKCFKACPAGKFVSDLSTGDCSDCTIAGHYCPEVKASVDSDRLATQTIAETQYPCGPGEPSCYYSVGRD